MFGVPASNFIGGRLHVALSYVTSSTISPPRRNGSTSSITSGEMYSPPMPVGPAILWPENAMKSQPISCTSTGMCGTLCAASTSTRAPTRCAASAISFTGVMAYRARWTCA